MVVQIRRVVRGCISRVQMTRHRSSRSRHGPILSRLVSRHVSADGTLVRANASFKSFVPVEVALDPGEYKRRLRAHDAAMAPGPDDSGPDDPGPDDPGNRIVDFRGEKRTNATHRWATDPDCRYVSKGSSGTGAYSGYTVNALMENRHRFLLGLGVETFRGVAGETAGCLHLLDRAHRRLRLTPLTLGPTRASSTRPPSRPCSPAPSRPTSPPRRAAAARPTCASGCSRRGWRIGSLKAAAN
jgi:hypothetical protein